MLILTNRINTLNNFSNLHKLNIIAIIWKKIENVYVTNDIDTYSTNLHHYKILHKNISNLMESKLSRGTPIYISTMNVSKAAIGKYQNQHSVILFIYVISNKTFP